MKGQDAVSRTRRQLPHAKVRFGLLDLASLDSVRAFATIIFAPPPMLHAGTPFPVRPGAGHVDVGPLAIAHPQIATASNHSTVIQIQGSHNTTR